VGFRIGRNGIRADPEKLAAITDFPTPASRSDLRSFLGMAGQLAAFTPAFAEAAQPLRELLKTNAAFMWTDDHDAAVAAVKAVLTSAPVLAPFDPSLPATLHTDASRLRGLGYVVTQLQGEDWAWRGRPRRRSSCFKANRTWNWSSTINRLYP